jgi:NAD(P)-dependent dehydrogenase (short-subunit alcohol dehydrogenase family)
LAGAALTNLRETGEARFGRVAAEIGPDVSGKHSPPPDAKGAPATQNGKPLHHAAGWDESEVPDRAMLTARLLETVRERTGYPIETLGLELDVEADLGIDSIKRVEILGKLRDEFPGLKDLSESIDAMDALARARTLGAIVDQMTSWAERSRSREDGALSTSERVTLVLPNGNGKHQPPALRRLLGVAPAPLPRRRLGLLEGGRLVMTDDRRGLADKLAVRLQEAGFGVERIGGREEPVEWTSPSAIDSLVDRLRSRGPLAGIVHALPLGGTVSGNRIDVDWPGRIAVEARGLFLLAKAVSSDLEKAARSGGACLIAATALGGRFASAGCSNRDFFPGHGGIAGLVKTLAREWPSVRCRAVDFAAATELDKVAEHLAAEVFVDDGWAEVGYDGERRIRLHTIMSPLERSTAAIELEPGAPVLISGGARGITALAAAELARRWRPTLLILGTTPLPGDAEPSDTVGVTREAEIKAALHSRLRRRGLPGSPVEIEADYQNLRRAREVSENLANLREAGATVDYAQADVRDSRALARVIEGWRARYGQPAGLIHGAGLIKDKLIREKSVESFDRVLETKLDGALNLIRLARADSLRFTVLFSSIAGRFGNVGQSDYAAANEILNKLALWLDRRLSGRVLSLIWGPWSGVGMVSQLESHLGRRGLGMIAPDLGRSLLIDELCHGRKGDVEVIYTGELGTLEEPVRGVPASEAAEVAP